MRIANYSILKKTDEYVILQDLGPWDQYPTITNSAEAVVQSLWGKLQGRRLFYYDSYGECDELVVQNARFVRFAHGCPFIKRAK